ncbi:MAG: FAD-dependent oxidoreductase [Clostridia bacterium]|nr:FAD-dependent oxidoreductase [Clostridia bacterium]
MSEVRRAYSADIAVIGGGPSGVAAAIAAGRAGARVVLIERLGYLGGMSTAALVWPLMTFHAQSGQIIAGIGQEIVDRLQQLGFSPGHVPDTIGFVPTVTPVEPEGMKLVTMEMVRESGVQLLLHQLVSEVHAADGRIDHIILTGLYGSMLVEARAFVDCTGIARLVEAAGGQVAAGREADAMTQPGTLMFRVSGVDMSEVVKYMKENPDDFVLGSSPDMLDPKQSIGVAGFFSKLAGAVKTGEFGINRDRLLFFSGIHSDEVIVNVTRVKGIDQRDPFDVTRAEAEGLLQAHQVFRFMKEHIPGFGKSRLAQTGSQIGIRESARPVGHYILTQDDLIEGREFDDGIARGAFPIDIHSPDGKGLTAIRLKRSYAIPYRSLVPIRLTNVITAGRAISVTHEAYASTRVMPTCFATGHAAGVAAAVAVRQGGQAAIFADVDVKQVRQDLAAAGAILHEGME